MKRIVLIVSFIAILFVTACQSAESKELVEYHNDFFVHVASKVDVVTMGYNEIDNAETNEEVIEVIHNKIFPILEEMKAHMDSQNPEHEDANVYHQLRLEWFELYRDIVQSELLAFEDYLNGKITDEELGEIFEDVYEKSAEAEEIAIQSEAKIAELAEKYNLDILE